MSVKFSARGINTSRKMGGGKDGCGKGGQQIGRQYILAR